MTDLLPLLCSPLVILLPGVSGDVLQVVKELLLKGSSVMNKDMKMLVQQVFDMISIEASFTCCMQDDINLQDAFEMEVKAENIVTSDCDVMDSKVKLEITVKLEQEE